MRTRGFTLVEVLVALVVLEVGLLGVVGTLLLAARTLRKAERLEGAVAEVQRVFDSLAAVAGGPGQGRQPSHLGEVWWSADGQGVLRVEFRAGDSIVVGVDGRRAVLDGVW